MGTREYWGGSLGTWGCFLVGGSSSDRGHKGDIQTGRGITPFSLLPPAE